MKAVLVAAFNQEKALVGAFSVIIHHRRLIVYSTNNYQCWINTTCFVTWRQESLVTNTTLCRAEHRPGGCGGVVVMKAVCLRRRFRIILIVNCDMISRTHKRHCCHQCHHLHNAGTCRTIYLAKIYCD